MKTNKTILSFAISSLLISGMATYSILAYAGDNEALVTKKSYEKSHVSENSPEEKNNESGSITICHVPPGEPKKKRTERISFRAWGGHKKNDKNTTGPDFEDYLGSCNSKATSENPRVETMHVISGCTGDARKSLEAKVQAFFEFITVADSALDDESVVTAMSQCLDNGDGDGDGDASSKNLTKGGGHGHDSVSDSGLHHRVRGCKKDGNVNYPKMLKDADTDFDRNKTIIDPTIVSDSSLDDQSVLLAFKNCVGVENRNKTATMIDSSKVTEKRGESGHQQQIVKAGSCSDSKDTKLREVVATYKTNKTNNNSTKDIVLTADSYNDVDVKNAVDACVAAGAKDSFTDSFSPTIALHKVTITGATVINVKTDGSNHITEGHITAGTSETAHVVGGEISGGAYTGGALVGTTLTGATITDATVYSGVSGRLSFRENTSPR